MSIEKEIKDIQLTDKLAEWLDKATDKKGYFYHDRDVQQLRKAEPELYSHIYRDMKKEKSKISILLSMVIDDYLVEKRRIELFENQNEQLSTIDKIKDILTKEGYVLEEEIHSVVLKKDKKTVTVILNDE